MEQNQTDYSVSSPLKIVANYASAQRRIKPTRNEVNSTDDRTTTYKK